MDGMDDITAAKDAGTMEAQAFDLRLRVLEAHERGDRLVRLVSERPDLAAAPAPFHINDAFVVDRLQEQVDLLSGFQRAVLRSKGWRLVQALRRPLRRAW
jgi:hypothetical protein